MSEYTLCWDCANSTKGGCSWADKFVPVDGWNAEETKYSYKVISCPEFDRDSYDYGQLRTVDEFIKMEIKRKKWGHR